MNYRFHYYPKVGRVEVAQIEGGADLAYDAASDDWYVEAITIDALRMRDGEVILPPDHPWWADIERQIYEDPDVDGQFWRERAEDQMLRAAEIAEQRHGR